MYLINTIWSTLMLCEVIIVSLTMCSYTSTLIKDYYKLKHIGILHLQTCNNFNMSLLMKFMSDEFVFSMNMNSPRSLVNIVRKSDQRIGIYVDLACEKNVQFLKLARSLNLFTITYEWLIWLETESDISLLEDSGIGMSSEITAVISGSILYDLYRPDVSTRLIKTVVGHWSEINGLHYNRKSRVLDLDGETILGSMFFIQDVYDHKNISAQMQDWSYSSNDDIINRLSYALHLHIADIYNFKLQLLLTDGWGAQKPDGHFSGILGHLVTGVTNVSVSPLLILPHRAEIGDILPPMSDYWKPFVFKQPRALGTYRALFLPLEPTTWLTVAFILLFAAIIFYKLRINENQKPTFSESIVLFIGIIAQQGLMNDPKTIGGRLICFTMLIMGAMVVLYYNAATMSALLSSTPPKINKIDQLVTSKVPLTLMDAPYYNKKEVRNRLLDKKVRDKVDKHSKRTYNLEEGLQIILKGGAFSAEFFTIFDGIDKRFKDSQKCDLTYIPAYKPLYVSSYFPKKSHIKELYTRGFLRLMEHGLLQREKEKWIVNKPKCAGKEQFLFVSLEAITIALATLALGAIISISVLILEIYTFRKSKHKMNIKDRERSQNDSSLSLVLPVINTNLLPKIT